MDQQNKRPMRVTLIAWLFIAGGVLALLDVLGDLVSGKLNLNLTVFQLPVGIGLLRGKPSSRSWATFWIIIGSLVAGLLAYAAIAQPENTKAWYGDARLQGDEAVPYAISFSVLMATTMYITHRLLFSPKANAYFKRGATLNTAEPLHQS